MAVKIVQTSLILSTSSVMNTKLSVTVVEKFCPVMVKTVPPNKDPFLGETS